MSVLVQETLTKPEQKSFNPSTKGFRVSDYTDAPLRMQAKFHFDAPAETVFSMMTDPNTIAEWFGMVKGGSVDHHHSCNFDAWGEGSKRYCDTSMGRLDETIYFWDAPHMSAYNVKSWSMPVKDHCGVIEIEAIDDSQCKVVWSQYFNDKGMVMRFFFPHIMKKMMYDGLQTLTAKLGGRGGQVELL